MFDLSSVIDLARNNLVPTVVVVAGAVGGLGVFVQGRRRKAHRIDQGAGAPPAGLVGQLMSGIDTFMWNRERAARRSRVLEHTVRCEDPAKRKDIVELEKTWTGADTQEELNGKIAADPQTPSHPELEGPPPDLSPADGGPAPGPT